MKKVPEKEQKSKEKHEKHERHCGDRAGGVSSVNNGCAIVYGLEIVDLKLICMDFFGFFMDVDYFSRDFDYFNWKSLWRHLRTSPTPSDIKISLEIPIQNISFFVCGASNQSRAGKLLLIKQRKFCSDNEIIAVFLPVPLVKVNVNGSLDFYFHLVLGIGEAEERSGKRRASLDWHGINEASRSEKSLRCEFVKSSIDWRRTKARRHSVTSLT